MSDRLAPRYARYGLLASFVLAALKELEDRDDPDLRPSKDDAHRLDRMKDLLATSWEGALVGNIDGVTVGEVQLAWSPTSSPAKSTSAKLDDARVVLSVLPTDAVFAKFVPAAGKTLSDLAEGGLGSVEDREFLDGSFKEFLQRLSTANRGAGSTTRRAGRARASLA